MKPFDPPPQYLEFLRPFGPEIAALALAAREMVLRAAPGCSELIYDAYNAVTSGYTFTGRPSDAFIHIPVYPRWVNIGFNRGSLLKDPAGILRGTGRWIRHVRIEQASDLKAPALKALVRAAVQEAPVNAVAPPPTSTVRAIYARRRRPVS